MPSVECTRNTAVLDRQLGPQDALVLLCKARAEILKFVPALNVCSNL